MAIFGIGAYYDTDISDECINKEVICIGWSLADAPALHQMFGSIKVGDIVFIKSHNPSHGLFIKAVGIVKDNKVIEDLSLGHCMRVKWLWDGEIRMGKISDKHNVRSNTLFEEFNPDVQTRVLDQIFNR